VKGGEEECCLAIRVSEAHCAEFKCSPFPR
jgi:hypothetical protein